MGANFSRKAVRFPCALDVEDEAQADSCRKISISLTDSRLNFGVAVRWEEEILVVPGASPAKNLTNVR